jgi:hypothetical protein
MSTNVGSVLAGPPALERARRAGAAVVVLRTQPDASSTRNP